MMARMFTLTIAVLGRWFLLLVGMIASSCYALEMARVHFRNGQALTSSTLHWVDLQAGKTPPQNAIRLTQDGPLWCRAKQSTTWFSGAVENGTCQIPFLRQILDIEEYDVLVSVDGFARIIEKQWYSRTPIPDRVIATPNMLLALEHTEEGDFYPGYVSIQERKAYIVKDGKILHPNSAIVLTEDEPEHYNLDQVVMDDDKSQTTKEEEVVAEKTLSNPEKSVQLVTDMLDFAAKEVLYWGRIRGTITGRKSTVIDSSGNEREITWGIQNELEHLEQQMVEYELPGEASIDVKLVAVMYKYEAPYSAKLTSIYSDQVKRQHTIDGLHIHTRLAELRADFSQPYFTQNKSEIAGEYIPSQILIHSTTTTTTTTTTTPVPSSSTPDGEKPQSEIAGEYIPSQILTHSTTTTTTPVKSSATPDVEKSQSDSLATSNSGNGASVLLSFSLLGLLMLMSHNFPVIH